MQIIVLKILEHRNAECIGIYFKVDTRLNGIVKKIPGIKWSRTHTCWYLPLNRNNYQLIMDTLRCQASINNAALKKYIIEEKEKKED